MNWMLRLLGIEKTTEYFVSYRLYKGDIHTHCGDCRMILRGQFDLDAIRKHILIDFEKDEITNVVITCISRI